MKKWILVGLALAMAFGLAGKSDSQTSEYRTAVLTGTADVIIDSTMLSTFMRGRRLYINGIYVWWDNGVNTNQMFVEVVRGGVNLATQGAGRQFKYSEQMTSGGIKAVTFTPNITTGADSSIYFLINGSGTDSVFMAVNYTVVN